MTLVGATYQTILNRLMLQSCQLCDGARNFQYDPHINHIVLECVFRNVRLKLSKFLFTDEYTGDCLKAILKFTLK
jgi:hypothetical protein